MERKELIYAVSAQLLIIEANGCTSCPVNLVGPIVNAGAALGLCIMGGAYDEATNTRVLYTEKR